MLVLSYSQMGLATTGVSDAPWDRNHRISVFLARLCRRQRSVNRLGNVELCSSGATHTLFNMHHKHFCRLFPRNANKRHCRPNLNQSRNLFHILHTYFPRNHLGITQPLKILCIAQIDPTFRFLISLARGETPTSQLIEFFQQRLQPSKVATSILI